MTNPTDEQQSAARLADRGELWQLADEADRLAAEKGTLERRGFAAVYGELRQALHDRDRFQRERDYWREECINLTGEALA